MTKLRALSDTGIELFSASNAFSPKHKNLIFTKYNSWSESDFKNNMEDIDKNIDKNIDKDIENVKCFNFKINIKQKFLDFITSDFDKKLESNIINMRNASKKMIKFLHESYSDIPLYTNNAVTNLIILILTDGEKFLNKQKVKHNIHFYLKLAEKACLTNDHQTALLIKCALENFNITRLKIKLNKGDSKIVDLLNKKYGTFKNCHATHIKEFLEKYNNNTDIDPEYIPSVMVLHMHTGRNKSYSKTYTRLGQYPKHLIEMSDKLELLKKQYYHNYFKNNNAILTKLYKTDPNELTICKKLANEKSDDLKYKSIQQLLYILSQQVKNIKNNDPKHKKKNDCSYHRTKFLK